jgi:hypothetical protein
LVPQLDHEQPRLGVEAAAVLHVTGDGTEQVPVAAVLGLRCRLVADHHRIRALVAVHQPQLVLLGPGRLPVEGVEDVDLGRRDPDALQQPRQRGVDLLREV